MTEKMMANGALVSAWRDADDARLEQSSEPAARYEYAYRAMKKPRLDQALPILEQLAAQDYAPAQYLLGQHLLEGEDAQRGEDMLLIAASKGNINSQIALGNWIVQKGRRRDPCLIEAFRFYSMAAENGDPYGLCNVADLELSGRTGLSEPTHTLKRRSQEENRRILFKNRRTAAFTYHRAIKHGMEMAETYGTRPAQGEPAGLHTLEDRSEQARYAYGCIAHAQLKMAVLIYCGLRTPNSPASLADPLAVVALHQMSLHYADKAKGVDNDEPFISRMAEEAIIELDLAPDEGDPLLNQKSAILDAIIQNASMDMVSRPDDPTYQQIFVGKAPKSEI